MKYRLKFLPLENTVLVMLVLYVSVMQSIPTTFAQTSQPQNHVSPISVTVPLAGVNISSATGRVVGGSNAVLGEFPGQVYLRFYQSSDHYNKGIFKFCGGSLISRTHVLTAAHCVIDATTKRFYPNIHASFGVIDVRIAHAGVNRFPLQQRCAKNVVVHPNYRLSTSAVVNDVAVIQLSGPVSLNTYVQTVTLAKPTDINLPVMGRPAIALGWGQLGEQLPTSVFLRKANMNIRACNAWGNRMDIICASGTSSTTVRPGVCKGDSGSPLMSGGKQVGVNSFVYKCGHPTVPDGFARVSYFYNWIKLQAPSIR